MTTPTSGQAAAAREAARRDDGKYGVQQRAEAEVGDLVSTAEEEPKELDFSGFLTVDPEVRARVTKMTRMHDDGDRTRDRIHAIVLTKVMSRVAAAADFDDDDIDGFGLDDAGKEELAASLDTAAERLRRGAREQIGKVWESKRMKRGKAKLMSRKYDRGAAWSPEALRVVLDDQGVEIPGEPWSGKLELEHVVPAATLARLVLAMHKKGKTPDEVASALRECIHHVVVKDQLGDQPRAGDMDGDLEDALIGHYTGGRRLADTEENPEFFNVIWSRYLDPAQRDGHGRTLPWELHDLRTLNETAGKPLSER